MEINGIQNFCASVDPAFEAGFYDGIHARREYAGLMLMVLHGAVSEFTRRLQRVGLSVDRPDRFPDPYQWRPIRAGGQTLAQYSCRLEGSEPVFVFTHGPEVRGIDQAIEAVGQIAGFNGVRPL
jgi:hypothetical protein